MNINYKNTIEINYNRDEIQAVIDSMQEGLPVEVRKISAWDVLIAIVNIEQKLSTVSTDNWEGVEVLVDPNTKRLKSWEKYKSNESVQFTVVYHNDIWHLTDVFIGYAKNEEIEYAEITLTEKMKKAILDEYTRV